MNVDLQKRSALVKFKSIESAEKAASAYFNKTKDQHILGVPQIRVKYITQAGLGQQQHSNEHKGSNPEETKNERSHLVKSYSA